ncbi:non-ribosomal peptide synthetase [Paenibacillus sp. HW567]|uniref:non-ribosomal peptide synthetase n=1 Tax=Paenibacillus sp. HW567 TaxID=1034769 RepID=UPI00036761D5|nr:non-ribosomal peptide synthetase [Paenibacillus sp. HW567]
MKNNNELEKRRSKLSAEQRRLLEQWKLSEAVPEYTITSGKGKYAGTVSPAQMRLWFMDQLLEDKAAYNMYAAVRLRGDIQTDTIESAFRHVANRHENLRSNFLEQEGRPIVILDIHNPVHTRLYDDVSPHDIRTAEEEAQRLLQSFISQPFDLSGEPLFRTMLIRLAPKEHILAVCMHHIISDGWSMGILLKEWTTVYNALLQNSEPNLPEIPVSYADFAHWQIDKLESGGWSGHLHYWKTLLSGASSAALTPDNRHPERMEHNGNEVRFVLPGELYRRLAEFSVGSGLTLFTVLFSIFNVLLYRYTKETSIVTGTPIANRNYTEIEEIIGYFVNLLPLRVELDPQMSFRELAGRVMQSSQEAYSHQDFPFDRVIEELQPERTDQLIPLIRNLFVFQNQMVPPLRLNGIDTEYLELYNHTSKSDLLLSMIVRDGSIDARLEYDGRLFVPQTMQSFAKHFVRLAESAMEQPDLPICHLELLDKAEQQPQFSHLVVQNTEHFVIHQKFEQIAAKFSNRIALQWDSEAWTYGQLEQRANQIARYINGLGVRPGEFVGLFMERSPQVVASILGILKAGCAYVPMDPAYPEERIRFMLNDAGCRVILVDNLTEARLTANSDCLIVNLSSAEDAITRLPVASVRYDSKSTDLVYMIYTSGSTGVPKGVLIDHGNVSRLFTSTNGQFHFDENDVWSLFHSYAFDFSVWEIWGALLHGGKLVIVPGHVTRSFELFYELIVKEKITVLNQTPSAFKQLSHTEELLCSDDGGSGLNHLRYVIFGGEALELSSLETWLKRHGDECPRLINMYGITEITVHATYRRIRIEDLQGAYGHVIGNPLRDMRAYVLDEWMQMVPVGVAGELYIGGPGVSRGYWNREALNQGKFIQDPFIAGSMPQENFCRLYRSGDLARWTHENELEYVGRIDNQVKVRGFRIELGEVETAIQQNENVSQNVAVVEHNQFGDPRIVSYFIPYEYKLLELRRELQKKEQVTNRWELVFDGYYQEENFHEDKSFHIAGWNDSYSGEAIPEVEMEEWTKETVARIRSYRPRRILEVGCGTGLLLFRLAADCESYTAIDFSVQAIEYLRAHLSLLGPNASKVKLYKANAHDLDELNLDDIDMVIINSVAQYFPDVQYLNLVLEKAAKRLGKRGCIFLGDVCGMMFGEIHQSSVAMSKAELDMTVADFKRLVRHRLDRHNELMLDVSYFTGLSNTVGGLEYAELLYKRGKFHHEMNKYRFDAVLHKGAKPVWEIAGEYDWRQLREKGTDIVGLCLQHEKECFVIRNFPNSRIMTEWNFVQWYNTAYPQTAISAYPVKERLEATGLHQTQLAWESDTHLMEWVITDTASRGCIDAVFYPVSGEKLLPCLTLIAEAACVLPGANLPLRAKLEATIEQNIKASLKGLIPEYMIPSEFVALESFPLTVNGKIDRSQLRLFKPYKAKVTSFVEATRQEGTEMEEMVCRLWMDLLDTGYVGLDESFFEAGGHSLLVVQLMFQIKKAFKVHIPLLQLMQEPTVRGIAAVIERALSEQPATVFDFSADVALSPDITAGGLPSAARITGSAVLLTGATGFFGAFLLRELLEKGDKPVYCLVRSSGKREGLQRIVAALNRYGCWKDEWEERIIAIKGDLALPGLGLDSAVYKELSIAVTEIYHNGAVVNFAQPYASLAAANVGGCEEVLRLAATETIKPVHFISTLYVFSLEDIKSKKIILENDVPVYLQSLQLGYTQSKWAAEQLMREARLRGIPVNVFRLGRIAGDSLTGACQENDFFWRSVRLCLHLGIFPDIDFAFNLIPADFAAQAVIHLAKQGMENQTYHLLSRNDYTFFQVLDVLNSRGYSFELLPWEQWKCRVEEQIEHGGGYEDASVMPFIGEMAATSEYPQFDAAFTKSAMDLLSLPSAFVTNELLALYIDYFINRGFFMPLVKSDMG